MSNISEKAGNATDGVVGEQTLLNQATTLAGHSLDYAKGLTGLGGTSKTADAKDTVKSDSAGGQSLGSLLNESRELAANVLGTASDLIKTKTDEAAAATGDHPQAQGYVSAARDQAASLIDTASSYVKSGTAQAQDYASTHSTEDIKADVSQKAEGIAADAKESVKELKTTADAYSTAGLDHAKATGDEINAEAKNF